MKPILAVFALVACLSAPALADEAATTAPPQPAVKASPVPGTEAVIPALPPQLRAPQAMSTPLSASEPVTLDQSGEHGSMGGGCHHGETVYLTN